MKYALLLLALTISGCTGDEIRACGNVCKYGMQSYTAYSPGCVCREKP